MRIIAGACKGRRLKAPTWTGLRPTSDKLRETLFNIVAPRVPGARVLDVYAGSGAVGLEALSRGAQSATFIERDRRAADLIDHNAVLCGMRDRCVIIRDTAERALQDRVEGEPFDLVMLDPPYEDDLPGVVLGGSARLVAPGGLLIVEHAARRPAPTGPGARPVRTVRSGDSALTLYEAG